MLSTVHSNQLAIEVSELSWGWKVLLDIQRTEYQNGVESPPERRGIDLGRPSHCREEVMGSTGLTYLMP